MNNRFLLLAGLLGFLGVLAGTFGAHGLKGVLDPKEGTPAAAAMTPEQRADGKYRLETFETGVRYHLIHAAALLAVAALVGQRACRGLNVAGWAFVLGILIFPGSLYGIALTGQKWLGMVAPFGGGAFMVGWVAILISGWKAK